jgi:diphosphomevalonate decarboxylase
VPRRGDLPRSATFEAPPNIALVKYWGVRDPELVLPYNSSVSVTLARLRSRTRVRFSPEIPDDRLVLNGAVALGAPRTAVVRMLDQVRERAALDSRAEVLSENNFPTASGLASSASGFAALAGAASSAAGLTLSATELSRLARLGSGSASRSIFGGFVLWRAGSRSDGRDSYARSLYGERHWPELADVVALVENAPVKGVRSAEAMQATVRTSPDYPGRLDQLPSRIGRIVRAIGARDAKRLFPLVMEECDSFRNVCETTRPPLDYLTPASRAVLAEVRELNRRAGRPIAAYTHDAGAHVHVFTLDRHLRKVRARIAALPGVRGTLVLRPGPGARRVDGPRSSGLRRRSSRRAQTDR